MRQVRERVGSVDVAGTTRSAVADEVNASPVSGGRVGGLVVPQAPYDPTLDIAKSLMTLQPGLARFADIASRDMAAAERERAETQTALGVKARMEQTDNTLVPMTREQDPYWQRGYMKQHGISMGIQDADAIEQEFEKNRFTPGFNLDTFLGEQRKQRLQGMDDPDALQGYTSALTASEARVRDAWKKQNIKETRDNELASLNAQIAENIKSVPELNIADASASFHALQEQARQRGIPRS
jgi:hypothetical protein